MQGPAGLASNHEAQLVFALGREGVGAIDAERGTVVWDSPCSRGGGEALGDELGGLQQLESLSIRGRQLTPSASFSPGWKLLAGTLSGGGVALWDVRCSSPPLAQLELPGDQIAGCVYLDRAWEGVDFTRGVSAPPGHLLVSPAAGGAICIYDIRRLSCPSTAPPAGIPASHRLPLVGTLPFPERLPRGASMCFAVDEGRLVASVGAKSLHAFRWDVGAESLADGGGDEEGGLASEVQAAASGETRARSKPKRQPKARPRLPCRLANR